MVEYERLFLEAHKQQGRIAGLEEELARVKADLSVEKRSRAKAVSVLRVKFMRPQASKDIDL